MIEILILKSGSVICRASAKTPEDALYTARKLWDEALTGIQGEQKIMAVYFMVDGQLVRSIEGRRP